MKRLVALVVAAGLVGAGAADAACWTREEAGAAGVRQLQSMLMVTALRCQAGGQAMLNDYNAFVAANRPVIAAGNDVIRAHFLRAAGLVAGQRGYDAFTTAMANGYGAGEGAPASCAEAAALAREAATGSADALLVLVDQLALAPVLPEGRCAAPAPAMAAAPAAPTQVALAEAPAGMALAAR